jgi:PAS domain S-box-containing protein
VTGNSGEETPIELAREIATEIEAKAEERAAVTAAETALRAQQLAADTTRKAEVLAESLSSALGAMTGILSDLQVAEDIRFLSSIALELFRKSPDAVLLIEGDTGIIRFTSDQALTLTGYSRDELRYHPVEVLVPESSRDAHASHRHHYMEGPTVRSMSNRSNLNIRTKTGQEVPVSIMLAPVLTSRGIFVIATIRRRVNG